MEYNLQKIISDIKNGGYKLIGSGSSRKVYDLNDGTIIKVAKDIRGIYQNKAENEIYLSRKSNFFAQVLAISEDNTCLIMSKAKKIKNIQTVYRYYKVRNFKELSNQDHLNDDINNNKLSKGDLTRASSWGFVGDVPVLIDYGLTHGIYQQYYRHNLIFKKKFKPIHYS